VANYTYTLDVRLRIIRFSCILLVSQSLRVVHILELNYSRPRERPHSFSHIPFAKLYQRQCTLYTVYIYFLWSFICLIAYRKQCAIRGESIAIATESNYVETNPINAFIINFSFTIQFNYIRSNNINILSSLPWHVLISKPIFARDIRDNSQYYSSKV